MGKILFAVAVAAYAVIGICLGALMWASQVPPDDAVSNISKWARRLGFENFASILADKSLDDRIYSFASRGLLLYLVALFVFIVVWRLRVQKKETPASERVTNQNTDLRDCISLRLIGDRKGAFDDGTWTARLMLSLPPVVKQKGTTPLRIDGAFVRITRVSVLEFEKYPGRKLRFLTWYFRNKKLSTMDGETDFTIDPVKFLPVFCTNSKRSLGLLWVCRGFSQRKMEFLRYRLSRMTWKPNLDAIVFEFTVSAPEAKSVSKKFEVAYNWEEHTWWVR